MKKITSLPNRVPVWVYFLIVFSASSWNAIRNPGYLTIGGLALIVAATLWARLRPASPTTSRKLYLGLTAIACTYTALLGTSVYLFFNGTPLWSATLFGAFSIYSGYLISKAARSTLVLARMIEKREHSGTVSS
jgi:hypothetical protein